MSREIRITEDYLASVRERQRERTVTCSYCRGGGVVGMGRDQAVCDECFGTGKIVVEVENPSLWNKLMRIFGGRK